jgi:aryl-alcohol dehydrogenase-like predicted oxidoreductase
LVRDGKVHYIGCSNFPAWLICKSLWTSDVNDLERFVVAEPLYNLLDREIEREIIPLCVDQGIAIVPYAPFAGGVLSGKYKAGAPPPAGSRAITSPRFFAMYKGLSWEKPDNIKMIQELEDFSKQLGRPMVQIALAWLLANPAVTAPIVGASSVKQLEESFGATELTLSKADLDKIDQISPPRGPYFT